MESEESPEKKKRRLCLYNVQWESEFDWLQKVVGNATHAKCKLCCCTFSVGFDGKHAVSSHEKTKKHIHASESAASSHTLKAFLQHHVQFLATRLLSPKLSRCTTA